MDPQPTEKLKEADHPVGRFPFWHVVEPVINTIRNGPCIRVDSGIIGEQQQPEIERVVGRRPAIDAIVFHCAVNVGVSLDYQGSVKAEE